VRDRSTNVDDHAEVIPQAPEAIVNRGTTQYLQSQRKRPRLEGAYVQSPDVFTSSPLTGFPRILNPQSTRDDLSAILTGRSHLYSRVRSGQKANFITSDLPGDFPIQNPSIDSPQRIFAMEQAQGQGIHIIVTNFT
jgi:hypothetical protein